MISLLSDINNPLSYQCLVYSYRAGHSQLDIRVDKLGEFGSAKAFFLIFGEVEYFEGPVLWQGVNFELGSSEECERLLRCNLNYPSNEEVSLEGFRLFQVKTDSCLIKIIARYIGKEKTEP